MANLLFLLIWQTGYQFFHIKVEMLQINKIKIIITGFLISVMPVFVSSQNLQEPRQTLVEYTDEGTEDKIQYDDEIEEKEIPEGVMNSIKHSYPDHKVVTAYRGSDGSFKIVLSIKDEKIAAFYNAAGDFLKLEEEKDEHEENTNEQWR
jgi:hypothetical protein